MLQTSRHGFMRTLFATGMVLILQHSAYSLERIDCGGDGAVLGRKTLRHSGDLCFIRQRTQNDLPHATLQACRRRIHRLREER
jgi:hypothetical protein